MSNTLFVGGASPIGYQLAYKFKKNVRSSIDLVDIEIEHKKLYKLNSSNYFEFDEFTRSKDTNKSYDYIIFNLYELLDNKSVEYYKNNNHVFLKVLNEVIDSIQKSGNPVVTIMLNSYQYSFPRSNYQETFNLYNQIVLDFVGILSKIDNINLKIIFLPNILTKYNAESYVNTAISAIKSKSEIIIRKDYRDYILLKDVLQHLLHYVMLEENVVIEFTSGTCTSNREVYNTLSEVLCGDTQLQILEVEYLLKHHSEWFKCDQVIETVMIAKTFKSITREFVKSNSISIN